MSERDRMIAQIRSIPEDQRPSHGDAIEMALYFAEDQSKNAIDSMAAYTVTNSYAKSEPAALLNCLVQVLNAVNRTLHALHGTQLSDPRHIACNRMLRHAKRLFGTPVATSTATVIRRAREVIAFVGGYHHCREAGTSQETRQKLVDAWVSGNIDPILAYGRSEKTEARLARALRPEQAVAATRTVH